MKKRKEKTIIVSGAGNKSTISEMLYGIWNCLWQIISLLKKLIGRVDALFDLHRPPMSKHADVVELVCAITADGELGIKSIPKAIRFIRFRVTEESPYYAKCVAARMCVKRRAKKCADGEEKAWRSITKMAQPNRLKKRKCAHNAPPGPVAIPDADWALGISSPGGGGLWNNSFPQDPCQYCF